MSNHLALATVTACINLVLQSAIAVDVPGATVTTAQPNESGTGLPTTGINLYLYNVAHNVSFRNDDLPTRRSDSQLVQRPRVALDLHYLITFYGDEPSLEPQRVLGSAIRTLHARPVLTRNIVQDAIASNAFLAGSNLADAVELVKLTPTALSLEEMSKLWSVFFQIPYTLSVAYQAMVVFIEADDVAVPTLPVRERSIRVLPFQTPKIQEIEPERTSSTGSITLRGENLAGDLTSVRISDEVVSPDSVSANTIEFSLPANVSAGLHGIQVVHELELGSPPAPHRGFESNVMPLVVLPSITTPPPINVAAGATLTLDIAPDVERKQRVFVLIGNNEVPRLIAANEPESTSQIDFEIPQDVIAGSHLLRVRIDGAESDLTTDNVTGEYNGPMVTVT